MRFVLRNVVWCVALLVTALPGLGFQMEPRPKPELAKKLEAGAAERIALPPGVKLSTFVHDDRVVQWIASLNDPAIFDHLDASGIGPKDDRRKQLMNWSDGFNGHLLELTTSIARTTDADFNPETDCAVIVFASILPSNLPSSDPKGQDERRFSVAFQGSRLAHDLRSLSGDSKANRVPVTDMKPLEGIEVSIEIKPDKTVFDWHETITGHVKIRNTGRKRVPINHGMLDDVCIQDEQGNPPQWFAMRGMVDPGPSDSIYKFLAPGDETATAFAVHTDPRADLVNGYVVPPGHWQLSFRDLLQESNIPMKVLTAVVEVRAKPGEYIGPRIVGCRSGGNNLVVLREDGEIAAVDSANGQVLGRWRVLGPSIDQWEWTFWKSAVSPDGRIFAYMEYDKAGPKIRLLPMYGPELPMGWIRVPPGIDQKNGAIVPMKFSLDGETLFLATPHRLDEIAVSTGDVIRRSDTPEETWPKLSGDDRYLVSFEGNGMHVVLSRGKDTYTIKMVQRDDQTKVRSVEVKRHGGYPEMYCGLNGAYFTDEFSADVLYQRYGGGPIQEFKPANAKVRAESPDGRLVIFTTPGGVLEGCQTYSGPMVVQVWNVAERKRLFEIDTNSQQYPVFVTNPLRIICAIREFANGASWFSERFKVHDADTGKFISDFDLTPAMSTAADAAASGSPPVSNRHD